MAQAAQEADADADKHLVKNQTAEVAAIKSEEPKTDTANTTDTQKKSTENEVLTHRRKTEDLQLLVSGADFEDEEDDDDYSGGEEHDAAKAATVATPSIPETPKAEVAPAVPDGNPAVQYAVFCKGKLKLSKKSGLPIWAGFWAESSKQLGPGSHTRYKYYYEKQNVSEDEKKRGFGNPIDPVQFSGKYKGYFMVKNQIEPHAEDIRKKEVDVTIKFTKSADEEETFTLGVKTTHAPNKLKRELPSLQMSGNGTNEYGDFRLIGAVSDKGGVKCKKQYTKMHAPPANSSDDISSDDPTELAQELADLHADAAVDLEDLRQKLAVPETAQAKRRRTETSSPASAARSASKRPRKSTASPPKDPSMAPMAQMYSILDERGVEISENEALECLMQLQRMEMTFDCLKQTRIGRPVNKLAKKHSSAGVQTLARQLVQRWKNIAKAFKQKDK